MRLLKTLSVFFIGAVAPLGLVNGATLVKEAPGVIGEKALHVQTFEMEGHTYIYFIEKGNEGLKQIIHDPNCKCLKK